MVRWTESHTKHHFDFPEKDVLSFVKGILLFREYTQMT